MNRHPAHPHRPDHPHRFDHRHHVPGLTRRALLRRGGAQAAALTVPGAGDALWAISTVGGDQENPQDMYYGEAWAHAVLQAVLASPAWPRTLLIYTYDEHGGYYDHVPPPAAIAPDSIPPQLASGDAPGGYTLYGPRVPPPTPSPRKSPT
ncbi:MAG: alkaline phosphatase family protein [Solirubrobacteraceae bacterium]